MRDMIIEMARDSYRAFEWSILHLMWEGARESEFGPEGTAFSLSFFDPLPREAVRGALRSLRETGMVHHVRGLWSVDGEPRGAGYALTRKARELFQDD